MEWHADERNYRGWVHVGDENGHARVIVHLSFSPEKVSGAGPLVFDEQVRDEKPRRGRDVNGDPISVSLDRALRSLHDLIEGRGGKRVVAEQPLSQIPSEESEHPW